MPSADPQGAPREAPSVRAAIRVVGADVARADRLARTLDGLGAEVRVAASAGGSTAAATTGQGPVDAVLVIVEGFEAVGSGLAGRNLQLVAVDPSTPGRLHGRSVLPVHAPGALEAWLGLLEERIRAARRSRHVETGLCSLLERDPDGLAIVDESQRVVLINPVASEIGGPGIEVGASLPFDAPRDRARRIVTLGGRPVAVSAVDLEWAGRPARLVRLCPTAGPDGFEGRLAHADRLVAMGALAAGFAHEVNNPAQTVNADLSELGEQLRGLERGLERARELVPAPERPGFDALGLVETVVEAGDLVQECFDGLGRIAAIVRDLKSFSRIQPDRVDWVHPNEIVNQACSIAHNHIRHRARLVKDLGASESLPGDKNKLVQVVTNLLVNAAEALPESSEDARVLIQTRSDQGRVTISVIDSGTGIEAAVLERIFEPFYTTKASSNGTGLGLAMSLDIARQHRGTLEVETSCEGGTRFDLILPTSNGLEVAGAEIPRRTHDILQRGRVLVVDDEPGILRSLARLIGRNHEVETRSGGRAAVELLTADDRFDVILCDLMMPDLDGPAFHHEVVGRLPHLVGRLVFMSGGAFTDRARGFLERVKPMVLDKPAPAELLEDAIQRALARPEETAELPAEAPRLAVGTPTRSFD